MTISRGRKTEEVLQDAAVADAVRTFIAVQARDWVRRQQNELIPQVLRLVDDARAAGDAPDVPAIIRQVHLDRQVPKPALETGE